MRNEPLKAVSLVCVGGVWAVLDDLPQTKREQVKTHISAQFAEQARQSLSIRPDEARRVIE